MAKHFLFEILTPDRVYFSGEIESLMINSTDGRLGVLADAASKVVSLKTGVCRYLINEKWTEVALGNGFMEVYPKGARAFVQFAASLDELNTMTDEEYEAQDLNKKNRSRREFLTAKTQLARQFTNLQIKTGPNQE